MVSRRDAMRFVGGGAAALAALPARGSAAPAADGYRKLTAAPSTAPLGAAGGATRVWAYDGTAPGPVLRARQGETLRIRFRNGLDQPSTVHWHGIRLSNAMDGVAGLTQEAVPPGGSFDYAFTVPDAGTFWYHPHNRSWEQMARGLHGVLVVEERDPPPVDRDLVLVFDDWRLDAAGQIHEASFGHMMDWSHAGRLGNWLTVNGRSRPAIAATSGERLRLRLVNCANARIMALGFADHLPVIVALDGQPVTPRPAEHGVVVLAPGQRADVIVEMEGAPGSRAAIAEVSGRDRPVVARLVYGPGRLKREAPLAPVVLAANPLPARLDLAGAVKADLVMQGGAMGGMRGARLGGQRMSMRELVGRGMVWAFNGVAGMTETPLLTAPRGRTVAIRMVNDTAWPHAMHLHGHHFRVIERNGASIPGDGWRDTVLLGRRERATVAFVADNPGKWLLHCHMLEHQAAGMVTWLKVG